MVNGNSLIDYYLQSGQRMNEDEVDWFEIVSDIVLDHYQATSSMIDTFNLFLYSQKGVEVKQKVVALVKLKFQSLYGEDKKTSNSISADWQVFSQLRWPSIYRRQCMYACNELIRDEIEKICEEDDFVVLLEPQWRDWLHSNLFEFLRATLFPDALSMEQFMSMKAELERFAIESFVLLRSKKLFEIILDFPDSLPAVKELRQCVQYSSSYLSTVAQTLRSILERRLLHLGASTHQILDFYIAMIKVLRIIDASDVLLHFVSVPVRACLKSRPDSIRCIISSLTETKDSDLHDELKIGTSLAYGLDEDDEDVTARNGSFADWTPPTRMRVLADSELLQHQSRGLDILATLVSIYGSTELFIAEYRSVLAEKLLDTITYNTDAELVNVELMKIRFGEDSLHQCEVMLRDVEDSKRTNTAIVNRAKEKQEANLPVIDMLMVSEHYWPVREADRQQWDTQKIHANLQAIMDDYQRRYHDLKKPRTLTFWLTQGYVDLTLDFDDGSVRSFKTTLLQANLLYHLSDEASCPASATSAGDGSGAKRAVSAKRLSELTEIEVDDILMAMRFWLHKGVVRLLEKGDDMRIQAEDAVDDGEKEEEQTWYWLEEDQASRMAQDLATQPGFVDDEEHMVSASSAGGQQGSSSAKEARRQAAKDYCEQFVHGLLRAHGAMALDRLQTMLTMMLRAVAENGGIHVAKMNLTSTDFEFVQHRPSFLQFLQGLIDRGVLDIDSGMYCEPKR